MASQVMTKRRTIQLRFADSAEDRALHAALHLSSERADRRPVSRQVKHLLRMAMGLDKHNTVTSFSPSSRRKKVKHLHLVSGGAGNMKSENIEDLVS